MLHAKPSVTIRDVPEATRDELAARVARSGRSMQEYLRAALIALLELVTLDAHLPHAPGLACAVLCPR
jgi:plasmid stability protein